MKTIMIRKNADDFILEKKAQNASIYSLYSYKSIMKDFLLFLEEHKTKTTFGLNQHLLDEYSAELIQKNIAGKTILSRAKFVNQFMIYLGKPSLKMQRPKFDETRKPSFDIEEINTIIKKTTYSNATSVLCYFLLATGARSRSVRNIKVQDIDFETGFIFFIKTKTRKIIKVPLCKNLEKLLHSYIELHKLGPHNYLFFNDNGDPLSKSSIYRRIQSYLESIGIESKGVHIFRHTFAKACVLNGCDTITLAELMGHSKIEQSQEYVLYYSMELKEKGSRFNPVQNFDYLKYKSC